MEKPTLPLLYKGKRGGVYKMCGDISLTPTSAASAGDIIGSIRWTDPEYMLILTSFGIRYFTTTGLSAGALVGITIDKATDFTVADTDGTEVTDSIIQKILSGMPDLTNFEAYACSGTDTMTAGTRTIGNPVYKSIGVAGTAASIVQTGSIYALTPDNNDPIILEENTGLEFVLPYDLAASKNMTYSFIANWAKVPNEIIADYYGSQR